MGARTRQPRPSSPQPQVARPHDLAARAGEAGRSDSEPGSEGAGVRGRGSDANCRSYGASAINVHISRGSLPDRAGRISAILPVVRTQDRQLALRVHGTELGALQRPNLVQQSLPRLPPSPCRRPCH
jgi:hypothetical protein